MNFAKKSISIVLAGVMAASSLFVGITASAAIPTYTPTAATGQTFAATNPVVSRVTDKYGDTYTDVSNDITYFSYTPAATGTYALVVNTSPLYRTYDNVNYKNIFSNTSGEERIDDASVGIYEDQYLDECVASASPAQYTTNYVYNAAKKEVVEDTASIRYVPGYSTVTLIAGETYYIAAYSDVVYNSQYTYDAATDKYVPTYSDVTSTQGSFSIVPVDYTYNHDCDYKEIKVYLPADYDGYYSYSTESNGAKYVTRNVLDKITTSTTYTGLANDVVVPASINGVDVTAFYGTVNKNIKSVSLPATIKSVSGLSDLKSLATVNLNAGVEEIGSFANDTALTSINIPGTVKTIDGNAFSGCTALANVTLNEGTKAIGYEAFCNTALKGVVIPASVASIGSYAFGYVSNLNANTVDPYDLTNVAVAGFAIGGRSSEEAAKYAAQNGFGYYDVTTGCPHPYITETVAATLFAKGSKTSTCPLCTATAKKTIAKKTFKIKSLKSSKKGRIIVKTAALKGITGYQVQYSTSKKFTKKTTKTVKVKSTKALNKTIKGLKSGKKYFVRVRATGVNAKGKTVYSKYTATKSVKVK